MNKCFCHFNGYEVKDAKARNEINSLKETKVSSEVLANENNALKEELKLEITKEIEKESETRINENNKLQSQINNLASGSPLVASSVEGMSDTTKIYVNTSDGNWYYHNGTTWEIGGVYQATSIEDEIENLVDEIELSGTYYQHPGYYANGVHNEGSYLNSKSFDVSNFTKLNVSIVTAQYYDIYTFLDESGNALSYLRELYDSKTYVAELDVPEGAKFLVINGTKANMDNSVIKGIRNNTKKCSLININPLKIKNGLWHISENKYADDLGYLFAIYDVSLFDYVIVKSKGYEYTLSIVYLDENLNRLNEKETFNTKNFFNGSGDYEVGMNTRGVKYIGVTYTKYITCEVKGYGTSTDSIVHENVIDKNTKIKKIVWLGTSIPASGKYGKNNVNSYPFIIGNKLNCDVINESVGSSSLTCKSPDLVSTSNPYGFKHDFELCSRCLTNTIAEMNWIIDNFDNTNIFTSRTVSSLSDEDKEFIRSCSYENKLLPYLTDSNVPDLIVFDHGHNDSITDTKESVYDGQENLYCYQGAMRFLLNKIYEFNPQTRVVMIGEYENLKAPNTAKYQEKVAKEWSLPIYKQWEIYGWSNNTVETYYKWVNGVWTKTDTKQSISIINSWLCDGIHPHSDKTGGTIEYMASHISEWLKHNIFIK